MTIDEAIKHCEEVVKTNDKIADTFEETLKNKIACRECASEHRQLAEWLRELKAYQKAYEEIRKLPIVWEFGEGVIRCLTIIEDCNA